MKRYQEMRAAKEWGIKPSEWDALDELDKAEMMAFVQTQDKMEAKEAEEHEHSRS